MTEFSKVARVTGGDLDVVPDWTVIMDPANKDQHRENITKAARHIWSWLRANAALGSTEFTEVRLSKDSPPAFTDSAANSIPGWRWDGNMTDVYIALWLSLKDYLGPGRDKMSPESSRAGSFRAEVATYLKYTGNTVNVNPGWFISSEWQEPTENPWSAQWRAKAAKQQKKAAVKPVPAPGPVVTEYICRNESCRQRFTDENVRDAHEETHLILVDRTCRVCGNIYVSKASRAQHERTLHPELEGVWEYPCPVPGCHSGFDNYRGLGQHIGERGHDLPQAIRYRIIDAVQQGSLKDFTWPEDVAESHGYATTSVSREDAAEVLAEPREAIPAVVIANAKPAWPETVRPAVRAAALDAAEALGAIIGRLDELETENAEIRLENAELKKKLEVNTEDAALLATFRALISKEGK